MRYALLIVALTVAASIATFVRYQSLHPCDWMEQDLANQWDVPRLIARTKIRAEFLLDGVAEPGVYQCLVSWWELRAETASRDT